jgi:hypothetical protein
MQLLTFQCLRCPLLLALFSFFASQRVGQLLFCHPNQWHVQKALFLKTSPHCHLGTTRICKFARNSLWLCHVDVVMGPTANLAGAYEITFLSPSSSFHASKQQPQGHILLLLFQIPQPPSSSYSFFSVFFLPQIPGLASAHNRLSTSSLTAPMFTNRIVEPSCDGTN